MKRRYILPPQAGHNLVEIWRYLKQESNRETADRVESLIAASLSIWRNFRAEGIY